MGAAGGGAGGYGASGGASGGGWGWGRDYRRLYRRSGRRRAGSRAIPSGLGAAAAAALATLAKAHRAAASLATPILAAAEAGAATTPPRPQSAVLAVLEPEAAAGSSAGRGLGSRRGRRRREGGGGGGLGAGGDIFVMAGASLTIEGGSLGTGTVSGGLGSTGGGNGDAFGGGLFLQGNETITLAPASGTVETISGVIADQTGSGGKGTNAGAGGLILDGAGTVDLTAANTYTGGTTISAGTLQIGAGGTTGSIVGNVVDKVKLAFDRSNSVTFAGVVSGSGSLTQLGAGTVDLTAANTYTGGTTISAGTLQIGTGGTTGSLVGNVVDNAKLAFDRSNSVTFAGVVSGSGSLTQLGAGTVDLTAANTYTGGTTISAGTLQIGAGGTTGSLVGNVVDKAKLAFDRSNSVTFAGVVSGSGSLTQLGAGAVDLTAANTYTGGTTITQGVLELGNATAAGSGDIGFASTSGEVEYAAGATLSNTFAGFGGADAIDFSEVNHAAGDHAFDNAGTVTIQTSAGATVATFKVGGSYQSGNFAVGADASGHVLLTFVPTTYLNVSSASQLSGDIKAIDLASQADGGDGTAYSITL